MDITYSVLGADGQLGGEFQRLLGPAATALSRAQADLTDARQIDDVLHSLRPDVVINCAAYNQVDQAERESAAAFAVNAHGVEHLARVCRDLDCMLVHFSTNYVFGQDAERRTPYCESDAPGPINQYGHSKLAGENAVRELCPRHLVIRTCGLYGIHGAKGDNVVERFLRRAGEGGPVRMVNDQFCTPTYAADLARASLALLQARRHGLYHVTNTGACSWHEFAAAVFAEAGINIVMEPITSDAYPAAARRPTYSVLANIAYGTSGLPPLRPWRDALADYWRQRR